MTPVSLRAPEFDLALTLNSGQVFHWENDGADWCGAVDREFVRVRQERKKLLVFEGDAALVARYFALDHALLEIYGQFPEHPFIRESLLACRGMRILRQPLWECLATFLFSSQKKVFHIRQISLALRRKYGDRVRGEVFAFPTAERLAECTEEELRACGLGYRAKHLSATAKQIASGNFVLERLHGLATEEARAAMCELPGIGPKIANCVLLFALERLDAVPVDVWIGRILRLLQPAPTKGKKKARATPPDPAMLGTYAGYVQQYLFHHARVNGALPEAP